MLRTKCTLRLSVCVCSVRCSFCSHVIAQRYTNPKTQHALITHSLTIVALATMLCVPLLLHTRTHPSAPFTQLNVNLNESVSIESCFVKMNVLCPKLHTRYCAKLLFLRHTHTPSFRVTLFTVQLYHSVLLMQFGTQPWKRRVLSQTTFSCTK